MDDKNKKPVKPILSFEEMSNEAYSEKDKMPSTYSTGVATDVDLDTATELLGANNRPQFGIENFNSNIDNAIKTKAYQEAKLKAEEQGIGFEIIGALNQLVVGELVGGMLEVSGHLFDWDQVKTLEEGGITFGTFLSGIGSDIKEWTQELNPINVDPDVEAKGFGTGLNHGTREWFLSGLPSVGSALSILVPVAGEAKAVSILGEGIQATKGLMALNKLGKSAKTVSNIIDKSVDFFKVSEKGMSYAAKLAVKGTHRAAVSTHIEAGMEAVGAYKEEYKRLINAGIEESEAKKLAAETGDFVYKYNWANFMTNFLQQMVLLKTGPNLASGVVGAEEAAAAGEKKIVGRLTKAKEYAKQMGSEGFEEAYQFGVTEEGKYYSDVKAGITEANTFGERLGKYVKDGELWSSAFFGGLGGAVFHKYGNKLIEKVEKKFKGLDDIVSTQERKIDDLKTQHTRALIAAKNLAEAKKSGNPELILNAENAMSLELGVNSAINGTLDYMLNRFNNLKHMSKEEREANGIDADFISNIDRHSKNIIKAAEMYAENQQQYGPDLAGPITHREYQIEKLTEELPRVKEQYDSIVTKLPRYSESTIEGRKLVDKQVEIAALEKQALFYKLQSTNAEVTAMQADTIQKNITYLEDKIENLKKEYAEIEPGYSSDLNDADRLILNSLEGKYGEKLRDAKFRSNMYEILIKNNTDELNFITSKKGQEEMTMRAKAAAAANEARKKNKEAVDESEEAEMQGVVDEVEIPMNGPGLEAAIADGSLTEEIINNHPKLKKIWDDYKNGVVEDTEEDFNEDSATTLNFENETTKEDSNTANENITIATTINEVETPVNIETEEEIVDMEGREFVDLEEINELTNISSLAYKSSNNVQAYDKDKTAKNKAVSNWLENPLNITEDDINAGKIEVRFSIDKEHDMFRLKYKSGTPEFEIANALSGIEEGKARLPENIGKVPIKATFYKDGVAIVSNGQTMEIFLHDHDYENYKDKESAATEILRQKEIIVSNLIKGITMSSVITKKSNGHIRTAKNKATNKFDKRPLTDIFKDLDSVSFLIGSNDKKVNTDKVVDPDVEGVKTTNGAIYVKVKTANGNTFPLRTNVSNLSIEEANLIHALYADILNDNVLYKQNISEAIISFIKNNENLRIKNMSNYLDFDNLSYEELLNHLVFNGYEKTKHSKESKLFYTEKKENKEAELIFGKQEIIGSMINNPKQKEAFIKYLTENRRRQVSAKYLSNKEFGKYLITSGILTSNVVPTETGKLFVQPRVDYSPNFKVVKKEVKNTQQTTTPVSDITAKKAEIERRRQEELKQPKVILPIGTSGSGKSTFIKTLPQENLVVIEPDAMRVEFTGDINNKSKDKEIYEEAAKRAVKAIKQGKQVVFDTTNLTKDKRTPFIEAIKKALPTANIQYKLMELNPELAKQRIKAQIEKGENRANVPDSTIDRHAESYKQMLEDIKSEPITEFKSNEEINAKYDAELAALETQKTDLEKNDFVIKIKKIASAYAGGKQFVNTKQTGKEFLEQVNYEMFGEKVKPEHLLFFKDKFDGDLYNLINKAYKELTGKTFEETESQKTPVIDVKSNVERISDINKAREKAIEDRKSRSLKKDFNELNEPTEEDINRKYNALIDDVFSTPSTIETKPENRTIPVSKNNPILIEAFKETIETKDQTIDEDDFENDSATFLKFEVEESSPSEQPISPDKINKTVEKENAVDNSYDENLAAGMKLLQEGESDIDPFKAIDIEDFKAITPNYDTFDKEVAHIKSLLPEKIAIKLYDDYIQLLKNGNVAVGLFKDNMIHLSRRSPKGTGYHEAFHAVFRTMLSDTERAYLQKEAVKNYVAPTKEDLMKLMIKHQIQEKDAIEIYYEEAIADEFMDYMNGEGKSDFKYAKGIKGFFERLLDWFKSVFSSRRTTRKLFNDISTGKYKSKPVKLSRGVAYKEFPIKGAIHAWDRADVRDITKQLTFILLTANQSTVKNLGDLKNIKIDSIKSELQKSMARNAMAGNEELSHRANRVLSDLTFFVSKVKDYMFEMGISEKIEQVDSDNNDGSVIYKSSYETSGKDSAAQEVKLMVALTPKFKSFDINSTKNKDYDLDTYLGFPKFENFNNVWNKLEKNLTGLVDITRDGKTVSSFDLMIEKLTEKSMYHPSLGFIRNKLLGSNTHFKSQFHYSFSRFNGNYADALISGTAGNMSYRIADSNSFDKIAEVANIWSNNFAKNFGTIVPDGLIYNQEALDYLKENHLKLNESLMNDRINKKLSIESRKLLKNELEFLGIQLSKKAYGALIRQKSSKETNDVELNLLQRVSDIYDKLNSSLVSSASYTSLLSTTKFAARSGPLTLETNHILDQKFFKEELASYEAEFLEIIGENTVPGPDGTNIWISQDHNMMSILKSKIKLGDLSELESLSKLPYNTSSKWIKTLLNSKEARNNFDLVSYNNYKLLDNTDGGDKAKNLKEPDKINDSVNKHLSGYYVGLAEADKSQQFYIKGFDLENSQVMSDGKGGLTLTGGNAANILMSYFSDEIARMEVAFNHLNSEDEAIKIKEEDKLIYYHYNLDKNGNKTEGNWRKSYMFPNMDLGKMGIVIYSQVKGEENKILKVNKISNLTEEQKTELKNYIKDRFLELVNKDLETLSQYGIIKNDNGVYKNITIDATKVSKNYNNNVVHAVGDFTLNSIIGNIEFTKLFTQDPALFKFKGDGFEDFRKRIPVISASGKLQRIFNEGNYKVKESYNSAVIENIISPSKYFSDPKNIKIIALASGLTEEEVKESFSAYKEVNETDAQAWITIDLYRERLLAWGKWTDPLEEAFKRIKSGNETIGDNLMFAQPLKTVHAEKLILNGVATMQYNKQSEAVLLPGVVGKMKINNLLKAMEAQGIDHVITLDGKKVGARGITKITDDNNIILSSENIKLNSTTLSNRSLFLQQDLPHKGIKPTLVGTQMTKNVLSMLILTNDYQGIKGLELYNQYHDTISNLSNLGLIEIHKKLGFDTEKDMITNHTKFNESMVDAIKDNASTNVLDALQAGLELDTIFQYKTKMQNKTAAQITKTTVKQKQLGGSMIYTSSFGFESLGESVKLSDKLVKDEIFWFKKPNEELNPARLVENTTLNSKENSIFVELQKDLTEVELTKEQQDLLEGKNIKELEPTTDNLGLLIKVHCK